MNTRERTAGLSASYMGLVLRERKWDRMSVQNWELGEQGMDVGEMAGQEKM